MFYKQGEMRNGLPFNVTISGKETLKTFEATDSGDDLVICKDPDDMFERVLAFNDHLCCPG